MSRPRRTPAPGWAAALVLTLLLGACSEGPDAPDAEEATPQALAAAVLARVDGRLDAVAPLFRRDQIGRGDLAVELAFDRPEGGNTHVRVVVADELPFDREDRDPCDGPWECLDVGTEDVEATLLYEAGYPEEDPGIVVAWSTWEDRAVWAYANGPFVAPEDEGGPDAEVLALGEALTAIVTDPAVGRRTSREYAEAGQEICEGDDWLRWYGDGNGSPEPEDYRDWCG